MHRPRDPREHLQANTLGKAILDHRPDRLADARRLAKMRLRLEAHESRHPDVDPEMHDDSLDRLGLVAKEVGHRSIPPHGHHPGRIPAFTRASLDRSRSLPPSPSGIDISQRRSSNDVRPTARDGPPDCARGSARLCARVRPPDCARGSGRPTVREGPAARLRARVRPPDCARGSGRPTAREGPSARSRYAALLRSAPAHDGGTSCLNRIQLAARS